jgi:S-adenosylmethionine-diacylgycerolhomoserine-N-methlytransferase
MAPSTSPASPPLEAAAAAARLRALERFYRAQAWLYDWTRPFILFGRRELVRRLDVRPGERVLDVGCGTGWSFEHLARLGAEVVGVEPSEAMRARADARRRRLGRRLSVQLDPEPYRPQREPRSRADVVLFSYSLSMMPSYQTALEAAALDLREGGRIGVVDFLEAAPAVRAWLRACHVDLGPERLAALKRRFPRHAVDVRRAVGWSYFLFRGEREA